MNFDFSDEQKLLQRTARDFLDANCQLTLVREILEGGASYDASLWKSVAGLGWQGAALPESLGGAGFGYLELTRIAEEIGRALAPIPFGASVYGAMEALTLAGDAGQSAKYLPSLASGDRIGTLAIAERIGQNDSTGVETRFHRGRIDGRKIAVPYGDIADLAIVVAQQDGEICLTLVELDQSGVKRSQQASIDPSVSHAELVFESTPAELVGGNHGELLFGKLRNRAAVLTAFEQLGGAQRCLEMALEFAKGRIAFGRPIGSFQAIKHKLADMFAAVELARSNCFYGAWALSTDAPELPLAAALARISATEAFELCAQESIQIHGGVGFTWEYDCHLFLRRSKLLGLCLGSPRSWKRDLIQQLSRTDV